MLTLALALALAQTPQHWLFRQPNLPRASYAFFEFAPTDGAGMPAVCSTTAPTGAKGEVLTFTRATTATCTKTASGGLATTGIADGDLVSMSSGVARVEYDSNGVKGLLVEAAGTNLCQRFINLCDAAWADVGAPALTGSAVSGAACSTTTAQASPWTGTYATAAVLVEDDDGAAFEGRSQAITVSAGAAHTAHCYVKAGTRAEARISLDGTTTDITGLSTSMWSILEVTDASSSGTSIALQVLVGDAVGDTGTVIFGGCDVKTGSYRTSIIPTEAASATRNAESAVPPTQSVSTSGSVAATLTPLWSNANAPSLAFVLQFGSSGQPLYTQSGSLRIYDGTTITTLAAGPTFTAGSSKRLWSSWSGSSKSISDSVTTTSGAFDGTMQMAGFWIGTDNAAGSQVNGIISRVCVDPSPTRCR